MDPSHIQNESTKHKSEDSFQLRLFMRTRGRETILLPPSFDFRSTLPYSGSTNF